MAKRKKFRPERLLSKKNFGHATQKNNPKTKYEVFFHIDSKAGKSLKVAEVDRFTALEMLKEMDETGDKFSE